MYFGEAFLVAVLAAVPALATGSSVNVYFGQNGNADIGDVCADSSFEYITLAFINISPENGGSSGLPGSNFAGHCWAGNYDNNGFVSNLLDDCPYLTPGIEACQTQYGKKVLLSIGGEFTEASNYSISSYENGVEFANFIWGAYGPYDESWGSQPRPFDYGDVHVAVDGYDFDIESAEAGDEGYQGMIETLRSLIEASGRDDIITGAPQCPLDDVDQHMLYLLQTVRFDRLWIQFYNNPQCEILNTDGTLNSGFNYNEWEAFLADTPSASAKLHVGLPGSAGAAGTGYVDATVASSILCSSQSSSMFDGLMLWDQTFAAANVDEFGVSYNEGLYEAMRCVCGACPASTTTSSVVYSTSSTSTGSSVASFTPSSSSPSAISTTTSVTFVSSPPSISIPLTLTATSSAPSHSHSHTASQHSSVVVTSPLGPSGPESQSSSSAPATSSSYVTSSSGHSHSHDDYTSTTSLSPSGPGSAQPSGSTHSHSYTASESTAESTNPTSTVAESSLVSSTSSLHPSTRPQSWGNATWTSNAVTSTSMPAVTDYVSTSESSSSVKLSTRLQSWSNATWTSHAGYTSSTETTKGSWPTSSSVDVAPTSGAGAGTHTSSGAVVTSSTGPDQVTSTIWTTTIYTVTSCAATVTDCPAGTYYSTSSWALSTTVVSASSTFSVGAQQGSPTSNGITATSSPSSLAGSSPNTSPAEQVTSTIWSTEVHTITSCAPTVTDCPAGTHYSTTTFPISTTILPGSSASKTDHQSETVSHPISSTNLPGSITSKVAAQSETTSSSAEQWTTSTIFSTSIYTVTSCAATITDCPARIGSVTTEIVAVTTTICPVTTAEAASTGSSSPAETTTNVSGSASNSGSGGGSDTSSSGSTSSGSTGPESSSSGSEGSSSEILESSSVIFVSGTLTTSTHIFSTVFVTVPTSSSTTEATSPTEVANNAGAPGAGLVAHSSGSGAGQRNGTVTKTYSLAKVGPTSVVVGENIAPSKSSSTTNPVVTGGARRDVSSVGLAMLAGFVALVL